MSATLARTVNTGLSAILVIICILFFGSDAVRSFVFALMIGVAVGTVTSVFVASPVAYAFMTRKQKKEQIARQTKKVSEIDKFITIETITKQHQKK